ncbi:YkvA family protein [Pseudomonas kuykendallii]|uniref:Uncharacterized membrane protein YkvA, DUF1232 family n=1 Tax=Pseudomonas kuykendallii TaxID=1007099 RepID=A0A1H3FWD3_9PSED|nr:YkvA family protein [Pseudomonas kuykendallii]MCQ4272246.1 YkvA family protein [Pseudomonas kuykendallii]SDX95413.1 Uncharacterized membrane protein YkvA, DUF1232 family [Pseudomonas kuykendallii]
MKMPLNLARYLPIAERILVRGRLPALLLAVARKGARKDRRTGGLTDDLRVLQSLALAYWRGEYRAVSRQALLASVAALAYFLSPLDLIPDFLIGVGLLDDFAVLAWVTRTWSKELDAFRLWRDTQSPAQRAELERLPSSEEIRRER